ncbi:MAG: leucyl/phenylalanyl-tRNA--protein transferase [Ornithinimicrobium sp.]
MRSSHIWAVIAERRAFGTTTEPEPSRWRLQVPADAPGQDLVAVGADLEPGTLLAGYRSGLFPMGVGEGGRDPLGWWSPDPRGVIGPGDVHVSRSLSRAMRRFEVRIDTNLEGVMAGCADLRRAGGWITPDLLRAYRRLHRLGYVHSVEIFQDEVLVGGLFGIAIGGLFAGESMFRRRTDASKAALVALVRHLEASGDMASSAPDARWLIDVQWCTEHLARMGAREVGREQYLKGLPALTAGHHRWPPL